MRLAPYQRGSVVALAIVTWAAAACVAAPVKGGDGRPWADQFGEKKEDLVSRGTSRYWVLEPGYQLRLEGREKGKKVGLIVSVLNETKQVDGVETRVVEERETADGKLDEVSRNYFAISQRTKNVYYFGEDVDMYRNGKVTSHEGTWLAGKNGARYGLAMPANPEKGYRFYQELAPKVAMDRCEIVAADEQLDTPYGSLAHVVKVEETTPLEPGSREYKYYAPGIGIVQDGELKLVSLVKPSGAHRGARAGGDGRGEPGSVSGSLQGPRQHAPAAHAPVRPYSVCHAMHQPMLPTRNVTKSYWSSKVEKPPMCAPGRLSTAKSSVWFRKTPVPG